MRDYGALAASYDGLMADGDYLRRAEYLDRLLSERGARTVLDLACGTGTLSCLLAERGYEVTASDASEEMLAQAARKAAALTRGQPPLFLCQTMPGLRLARPVDGVICTLDALNYLTRERDLARTFRQVRRWLRPGGRFLFDVNTPHKLRRMDHQLYMDETEDSLCVWRTFFSEKTRICTYQVDLFCRRPDGAWDRAFEEHRERAWSREELTGALAQAGFSSVRVTGDLSRRAPKPEADRWMFTAE